MPEGRKACHECPTQREGMPVKEGRLGPELLPGEKKFRIGRKA